MLATPNARVASALVAVLGIGVMACDAKAPSTTGRVEVAQSTSEVENTVETASDAADRSMMLVFSRDYCTPCQIMKPWVAEVAAENPSIDVLTLNVDRQKYEHIGSFFKVTAVPSFIFVAADGQVAKRIDGLAKKEQMTKMLKELGWVR